MKFIINILVLIIGMSIPIGVFIAVMILPFTSTEQFYIGEYNETNLEIAMETCPDKFVGIDHGCNHISVYCEKYYYPYHAFTHCYDGRIEYVR